VNSLTVTLPGLPPSPNEMRRAHYHARSDEAATWRNAARFYGLDAANKAKWVPPLRVTVEITAICKTHQRRDPDNFTASIKPILDGMVDAGCLMDDSFAVIECLSVRQEFAKSAAVRVVIKEAE
jgi:Holliday junction resolvase RusA-like endonuclease